MCVCLAVLAAEVQLLFGLDWAGGEGERSVCPRPGRTGRWLLSLTERLAETLAALSLPPSVPPARAGAGRFWLLWTEAFHSCRSHLTPPSTHRRVGAPTPTTFQPRPPQSAARAAAANARLLWGRSALVRVPGGFWEDPSTLWMFSVGTDAGWREPLHRQPSCERWYAVEVSCWASCSQGGRNNFEIYRFSNSDPTSPDLQN